MAEPRPTPEEQLLRLIEKEDDTHAPRYRRKRAAVLGLGSIKVIWLSLIKGISQAAEKVKTGVREPNLKVLNKVCFLLALVLVGSSVLDFVFGRPDIEKVYKKTQRLTKQKPQEYQEAQTARPFLHYLEMVKRRNIFSPIMLQEEVKPEVKKAELKDMAKNLSLVGISMDPDPVAMIEDKDAKKLIF